MDSESLARARQLGKGAEEDEASHLRRVADELGGANSESFRSLSARLAQGSDADREIAAARLGMLGDRQSIAALRTLLESAEPREWEIAVHGLRHSRDRAGWLCLESVALDLLPTLESESGGIDHAFRLLVMGRTKTMDRLFRAVDGHSRSIPARAALTFSIVAVKSLPRQLSEVIGLRMGIVTGASSSLAPEDVAAMVGSSVDETRKLESAGWETLQQPRRYRDVLHNYKLNDLRFSGSG